MTNPNNIIGTNGAYSGRTSVDAFNDILSAFSGRGIVSGWSISPSSGMTITLGGVSGIRDVAIAVATGGAKTTINNRSGSPVSLTIEAAPATNSRIDAIVAYVSNPPQGTNELADNPDACGLIAVKGTTASTPTVPTEAMIRTAITSDGAVGSTAYYVVLGTVKVVAGVTTLTSNYITQGAKATIGTNNIADSAITTAKIATNAVTSDKIDFTTLKYLSGMPVAKHVQAMGYGGTIPIYRIGNFVFMNGYVSQSIDPSNAGEWISLGETIKSGYRPIWEFRTASMGFDNYDYAPRVWNLHTDGSMNLISLRSGTNKSFQINCTWITRDAFPEDDII